MTDQILTLLTAERDKLNRAIEALQGPTISPKRRGRPPKNPVTKPTVASATPVVAAVVAPPVAKKRARTFSAGQRKAQSDKLKAYWAAKRVSAAGPKAAKKGKKKTAK